MTQSSQRVSRCLTESPGEAVNEAVNEAVKRSGISFTGKSRSYHRAMKRVLITGMSGSGKSSVIRKLAARGYKAIDTDWDPRWEHVSEPLERISESDWEWREDKIQALLDAEDAEVLFISACVPNQGKFYNQFDHVVLLSAPESLTVKRLADRTTNPYGKKPEELADVLRYKETVEPMLRRGATLEINTSISLFQVVEQVLAVAGRRRL
jgi:Shikimate kinase